jgi:hypothetical protein
MQVRLCLKGFDAALFRDADFLADIRQDHSSPSLPRRLHVMFICGLKQFTGVLRCVRSQRALTRVK